jgi:hypothetical protein
LGETSWAIPLFFPQQRADRRPDLEDFTMRRFMLSLATTGMLLALAGPVLAQGEPNRFINQPPTANVPNPSSGTPNSSSGVTRPGGNAGNTASRPEPQQGLKNGPNGTTTEAPSLEMRQVGPSDRPDKTGGGGR